MMIFWRENIMELYHASRATHSVGDALKGGRPTIFYPDATDAIDSVRVCGSLRRKEALYCADSAEFAVYFLMTQSTSDSLGIHLYKVAVQETHKAPFAITHAVHKRLGKGLGVESLIKEYWNPREDWKHFEYLTMAFEVVEKMAIPSIPAIAYSHTYGLDQDLAAKIEND
jgi:hypothetical protein